MKPGDHPDFYRFAPPPGTSRESSIVLDREGRFWHDGERVDHPALEQALRSWIGRHPDDGRLILSTATTGATSAPRTPRSWSTRSGSSPSGGVTLRLFDGTEEPLDPETLSVGEGGAVYARVKGGGLAARFSRHAQTQLAPVLVGDDPPTLLVGGREVAIRPRA